MAEIEQTPVFARIHHHGLDTAVAYRTADGHLAVGAWRFTAPGAGGAARIVLASKVGTEQPTQMRLATMIQSGEDDPVPLVTLSRVPSSAMRLVGWRSKKTLYAFPGGFSPGEVGPKPL